MQQHLYGGKLEEGQTVTVDHVVQSFTVVVRSMNGVDNQTLKNLLQQKWEIVSLKENDRTEYVL